ncbi:MAG: glycosyltransferase family 4 protein [Chitinophagaceae bacterium]|nr:glycosyltransferase family 4 protein [Chitinophagaceae bacterium]
MAIVKNKILLVGLFVNPKNKGKIYRTASDQLAEVLDMNGHPIIKTSTQVSRFWRAFDILFTILWKSPFYTIAILPYYGSGNAFIIENVSSKLLKLLGKKIILVVHGGGLPNRLAKNEKKYSAILKRVHQVVCPSNYLKNEILKYGIQSIVIENVVKLSDYSFISKQIFTPHLLWMRAFEPTYNPLMAIRVFALVKKKYPTATLTMAGKDLGLLQQTKLLAQELHVDDAIVYRGYVFTEDKTKLAQKTDIYLCTNKIDNAPVTFIEMMAMGLPIVSVNVGGIPFIVSHEENGLLVNYDDDAAMFNCIDAVIQNPALGIKIAQNGLTFSKQYDEKVVLSKWEVLFYKLSNQF